MPFTSSGADDRNLKLIIFALHCSSVTTVFGGFRGEENKIIIMWLIYQRSFTGVFCFSEVSMCWWRKSQCLWPLLWIMCPMLNPGVHVFISLSSAPIIDAHVKMLNFTAEINIFTACYKTVMVSYSKCMGLNYYKHILSKLKFTHLRVYCFEWQVADRMIATNWHELSGLHTHTHTPQLFGHFELVN